MAEKDVKFLISDFACWIVAEIAHAKSAKPRRGSGRSRLISKAPLGLVLLCSRRAAHGRVGQKYEGAKDQAEW